MILLLSGRPGSGKSLRAVQLMLQYVKEGRPVYAAGFHELNVPGVAILPHVNEWMKCPPGSVIFADEVQKHWPKGKLGEPIPPVAALSVHRSEYSVDLVLVTQDPRFLDPHARRLVGEHEHRVRKLRSSFSHVYRWDECQEDPQTARGDADASFWPFPKECYGLYRSAEVHTLKGKLPTRLKVAIGLAPVVAGLFWFAFDSLEASDEVVPEASAPAGLAAGADASPRGGASPVAFDDSGAVAYLERFTPRVSTMPWTAPAYDQREVVADPQLYCVIFNYNRCRCYTEQVTPLVVPQDQCKLAARYGVYNPFRTLKREGSGATPVEADPVRGI